MARSHCTSGSSGGPRRRGRRRRRPRRRGPPLLPLVQWLLAIPHYIVLSLPGIAAVVVVVIGFFAVLFTGKWPEGMRDFVVGYARWYTRVYAYILFLTDEYPPFSLQ